MDFFDEFILLHVIVKFTLFELEQPVSILKINVRIVIYNLGIFAVLRIFTRQTQPINLNALEPSFMTLDQRVDCYLVGFRDGLLHL